MRLDQFGILLAGLESSTKPGLIQLAPWPNDISLWTGMLFLFLKIVRTFN